ncbi:hypothetical protein D3C85_1604970 [compost metagenome]
MHLLAGTATTAGHVKRYRHQIADFQVFDVTTLLDHFTGDFVPQNQTGLGGGAAAYHMLIRTTDIRRHNTQNHPVFNLTASWILHLWVSD